MTTPEKALDEIETALKNVLRAAQCRDTYDDDARTECGEFAEAGLQAIDTLRAALAPVTDDVVREIEARHAEYKQGFMDNIGEEADADRATLLSALRQREAEVGRLKKCITKLETPTLQWNPDSPETPIESVESLAENFADYGHPCGVFEVQNAHELPYTYHFYNVMKDTQHGLDDDEPIETYEVVCREITKEEYRAGQAAAAIGWFAKRAKWATARARAALGEQP